MDEAGRVLRGAGTGTASGAGTVSVLGRAAAIVRCFSLERPVLGVSELARRTGLPKSTVHRMCAELVVVKVLERREPDDDNDGGYRLGPWLFELGEMVPSHRSLAQAAEPIMEDLREATHQRIHLAVLDGVDVVYVQILGRSGPKVTSRVGGRLPAHATGVGKVILAYSPAATVRARIDAGLPRLTSRTLSTETDLIADLRKIRSVGMALDLEESHLGVSCVAAPVFGSNRRIRAGLSITGETKSINPGQLGPAVRTAAFTLTRVLRASGL